jgi:hypothetical protein
MHKDCKLAHIKEEEANERLIAFIGENEELIINLAHKKISVGEEMEYVSVKGFILLGPYVFQEASAEIKRISISRKIIRTIYLVMKNKKIEYRERVFSETICGVMLVFTLKVFIFK